MQELSNKSLIVLKGCLFLILGILAGVLLLVQSPTAKSALLLVVTIWAFCRFYFFAFHVLQRWVDPEYRFSGMVSLVTLLLRKMKEKRPGKVRL